jgi:hypothetical protein
LSEDEGESSDVGEEPTEELEEHEESEEEKQRKSLLQIRGVETGRVVGGKPPPEEEETKEEAETEKSREEALASAEEGTPPGQDVILPNPLILTDKASPPAPDARLELEKLKKSQEQQAMTLASSATFKQQIPALEQLATPASKTEEEEWAEYERKTRQIHSDWIPATVDEGPGEELTEEVRSKLLGTIGEIFDALQYLPPSDRFTVEKAAEVAHIREKVFQMRTGSTTDFLTAEGVIHQLLTAVDTLKSKWLKQGALEVPGLVNKLNDWSEVLKNVLTRRTQTIEYLIRKMMQRQPSLTTELDVSGKPEERRKLSIEDIASKVAEEVKQRTYTLPEPEARSYEDSLLRLNIEATKPSEPENLRSGECKSITIPFAILESDETIKEILPRFYDLVMGYVEYAKQMEGKMPSQVTVGDKVIKVAQGETRLVKCEKDWVVVPRWHIDYRAYSAARQHRLAYPTGVKKAEERIPYSEWIQQKEAEVGTNLRTLYYMWRAKVQSELRETKQEMFEKAKSFLIWVLRQERPEISKQYPSDDEFKKHVLKKKELRESLMQLFNMLYNEELITKILQANAPPSEIRPIISYKYSPKNAVDCEKAFDKALRTFVPEEFTSNQLDSMTMKAMKTVTHHMCLEGSDYPPAVAAITGQKNRLRLMYDQLKEAGLLGYAPEYQFEDILTYAPGYDFKDPDCKNGVFTDSKGRQQPCKEWVAISADSIERGIFEIEYEYERDAEGNLVLENNQPKKKYDAALDYSKVLKDDMGNVILDEKGNPKHPRLLDESGKEIEVPVIKDIKHHYFPGGSEEEKVATYEGRTVAIPLKTSLMTYVPSKQAWRQRAAEHFTWDPKKGAELTRAIRDLRKAWDIEITSAMEQKRVPQLKVEPELFERARDAIEPIPLEVPSAIYNPTHREWVATSQAYKDFCNANTAKECQDKMIRLAATDFVVRLEEAGAKKTLEEVYEVRQAMIKLRDTARQVADKTMRVDTRGVVRKKPAIEVELLVKPERRAGIQEARTRLQTKAKEVIELGGKVFGPH